MTATATAQENANLQQIGRDLNRCDILSVLGTKSQKASALKHHKQCYDFIRDLNAEQGLDGLTDEEILSQLSL